LLITFKCPKCDADNKFSLADSVYKGPYRCWKCSELFMITIEGNELKSCEPITEEEMSRQKEIEALKAKFRKR
jgi:hypothetical protein